jgi:hypothetical protein
MSCVKNSLPQDKATAWAYASCVGAIVYLGRILKYVSVGSDDAARIDVVVPRGKRKRDQKV